MIGNNGTHAMPAEEQAQFQKDMAAMDAQIAKATRQFNSPEFKQQMAEIAKQQADLKHLDFARMQQQIDAATAKINSPEFRQQMADIQKQIESGAMQRSMKEASRQMKLAEQQPSAMQKVDMARIQQQIDAATAKINSPEFKQKMENLQKQIESGAMQRSMEEASKQLKAAEDRLRQEQTKERNPCIGLLRKQACADHRRKGSAAVNQLNCRRELSNQLAASTESNTISAGTFAGMHEPA